MLPLLEQFLSIDCLSVQTQTSATLLALRSRQCSELEQQNTDHTAQIEEFEKSLRNTTKLLKRQIQVTEDAVLDKEEWMQIAKQPK